MLQITKRQVVRILILWLQVFISTFKGTSGSGKVTVQLVDYKNSESRDYSGACCDNLGWCVNDCDNYFRLCFAKTTSADKCSLWNGWTTVLGDDSFSFSKSLGNGIMNPLTHSFTRWQPILFSVEVWDDDTGSANDLVDRYSLSIQTTPSPSSSTAAKRHKLSGKGSSYLNVDVKVFCDANYFIPDCSTYCAPRDDNSGHYTCDFTRGQKVCLSGWHGSDCLTHCVPRNNSLGHYNCDANGQIKCLDNWFGRDCLRYCKARNDSSGHYSCDVSGQRWCLSGWYGNHCLTYCVARNDSLGHYSCNANGQKKCLPGWHGSDCLTHCVSRNDSFGHYSCDANGQINCLDNWYGRDCLRYCKARNDSIGHYSCDINGQRKCLSGWHGSYCLTYCVSRNNSLGHYSCDANGQRHCLSGWYGNDCLTYCVSRNDSSGHYSCDANGQIKCLDNWYGRDCLRYCKARNDSTGHYSCDVNGQRQCLSGWHGNDCLIYCVPKNDSSGHYSCDGNGQRNCLSGWHGSDCFTYCVSRNDSSGHYSCDINGQKKCMSGWHGSNCITYCVSRNDSLGHYSCDANGIIKCLDYWYGRDCLIYCKPRNDSLGHYTCNSTGFIVCLPGWRGETCTESEMPRASFTTPVIASTKGPQRQMSSPRVPSLPGDSSLKIDASTFLSISSYMPLITTDKEVILQPTETTRITVPSKLQRLSGLQSQMYSSQVFSLQPSASSQQTYALTFTPTPSIGSLYTKGAERTVKQTKSTKSMIPSKIYSTLRQSISQTRDSSLKASTSALMPTSSTEIVYLTKHKELTAQPTEMTRVTIPSTLNSISRQGALQTRASNLKTSAPNSVATPSNKSFYSKEREVTETTKIPVYPSTPILQLVSSPSVESLCSGGNEETAEPTFEPNEISVVNSGILVEFREKEESELVVLEVISAIKAFLPEQLNKMCRRNAEECSLSEEDTHSAWFCPRDVNVRIHDVTEKGVSLEIASTLPPPLNGMVPSQTLMEILNKSKEDLEYATQADITWIHADGLTTPRTRIYGKPDQLSRVSERHSTSPLPYILGIAGAVLILAVVLFVVRAKVAKRNMIHPDRDDDLPPSPPPECQAESDTIVLLSRTKEKYVYKSKEKTGLNVDGDLKAADDIEEIYL